MCYYFKSFFFFKFFTQFLATNIAVLQYCPSDEFREYSIKRIWLVFRNEKRMYLVQFVLGVLFFLRHFCLKQIMYLSKKKLSVKLTGNCKDAMETLPACLLERLVIGHLPVTCVLIFPVSQYVNLILIYSCDLSICLFIY